MNFIYLVFGEGKDLTFWQMGARALIIFIIGLMLIKLSGRRSFGMQMSFDNVIVILLGAILSRAVVGVSPFVPVIFASLVIVLLHRLCAWGGIYSKAFGKLIKGDQMILYENGELNQKNMKIGMISLHDLMEGMRENSNLESFDQVKTIYLDRNGKISVIKK
jgi:uncharacterized membrane protein YcaP (DUF421 family)